MDTHRLQNAVLVAAVLLAFTAFVVMAEGMPRKKFPASLETTATTTTLPLRPSTTTTTFTAPVTFPTTTTRVTPTTGRVTTTTAKSTTATTAHTATTRSTTATTTSKRGVVTEESDNTANFVHNADGSTSQGGTTAPANDAFSFSITATVQSVSGDIASVRFTAHLDNESGRNVTFPGGLQVALTVQPSTGSAFVVHLNATSETSLANGATITLGATEDVQGYDRFDVTGTCQVDYGS